MNPTLSQQVRPCDDVLFQEVGGEAVLLNLGTECYFGLDPVGTRVWLLLAEDPSLQRVFDTMLEEFDVDPDTLRGDVLGLVANLADAGLVKVS